MDMEEMEEMELKKKAMNLMLDMMCEVTGDKRMLYFRESQRFYDKLSKISMTDNISNKQFEKFLLILERFNKVIDDFIKEENIEINEEQNSEK